MRWVFPFPCFPSSLRVSVYRGERRTLGKNFLHQTFQSQGNKFSRAASWVIAVCPSAPQNFAPLRLALPLKMSQTRHSYDLRCLQKTLRGKKIQTGNSMPETLKEKSHSKMHMTTKEGKLHLTTLMGWICHTVLAQEERTRLLSKVDKCELCSMLCQWFPHAQQTAKFNQPLQRKSTCLFLLFSTFVW